MPSSSANAARFFASSSDAIRLVSMQKRHKEKLTDAQREKHALETLPKTMAKLQAEIAKQQKLLDDPDLYTKDRKKFDAASAAIAKAQEELAAAEDRWLELEVLREEIEQA